jgi:peptidoglycan/xylan/chitin deacetylase (PgdA/CDA1 family)
MRLAELEEQYNIRSAWYFVPASYRIDHGVLNSLRERGHEVGVHGYNHDGRLFANQQIFEQRSQHINAIAKAWQASGFRSPMMHRHLAWMQDLDIAYDASFFDIDPYQAMPGGVGGVWPFIAGRFVELPCTLPQDHTLFVTLNQPGIDVWRKKHELIRRLRGMAMYLIHPDYLETPRQWDYYRSLLEYLNTIENDWRCLPHEAAQWWKLRQSSLCREREIQGPAAARGRTVLLDDLFTELQPEAEQPMTF